MSAGRVRGEDGVSGMLVGGGAGAAGTSVAGLDIDGLRIGREIETEVADFEAIEAGGADSETTAAAGSRITGC